MKNRMLIWGAFCAVCAGLLPACVKETPAVAELPRSFDPAFVSLEDVARLLSSLPLQTEQMQEVHDAVTASAGNGYDEEYLMRNLFSDPGTGVGDAQPAKADQYARPLRELLREALLQTRASADATPDAWLDSLSTSDVQIYWPFSEQWQGGGLPVITFDPGDGATRNEGYALRPDGGVEKLLVDEHMAAERPVWVVNRNSDADYKSLELRRREDPSWGTGGGDIVVTKADKNSKTLVLRSIRTHRQFDSWLSGGSEIVVRMGSVEDFVASTEAEMRLYQPSITDFMIVVRRDQMGQTLPFNAVLVSEWTQKLVNSAFMMVEDDGGTRTTWKCSAMVKYNSRSYGFELEIPLNSRDDIIWRGSLSRSFIERYSGKETNFGDVDLVLELI